MLRLNLSVNRIMLLIAIAVAVVLFLYRLDRYPPGFYIDEASVGYNAYSLLLTGKDEWGKDWPVFLRFYGSYNPPVYTYLVIVSEALFGVTIFSVRLVSALAGVIGVGLIYILAGQLFGKKGYLAGISALTFATTPWIMFYARIGYEVNLAMIFLLAAAICLWRATDGAKWLIPAVMLLTLSAYTAYAERLAIPFLILGYLILFRKKILKRSNSTWLWWSLTLCLVQNLPHFYILPLPAFLPKSSEFAPNLGLVMKLREMLAQFSNYLSPAALFFRPDPDPQRSLPQLAAFVPWLVIPFLIGVARLWNQLGKPWARFVALFCLTVIIPASLTRDPFASHRGYPLVIGMVLIITLGWDVIQSRSKILFWPIFIGSLVASILILRHVFFGLLPFRAPVWMDGYEQMAQQIEMRPGVHFLVDQNRIKPSYINLAFFLKFSPTEFHQNHGSLSRDYYYEDPEFSLDYDLGNVKLRSLLWERDVYIQQVIVGDQLTVSESQAEEHHLKKEFEIDTFWGQPLFIGWKTDPVKSCLSLKSNLRPLICDDILNNNEK